MYMNCLQVASDENEVIMKALVSLNAERFMEALNKYKDVMDPHIVCKNGTTIACAAARTKNLLYVKALLEDSKPCKEEISSKRLRTACSSIDRPFRDFSNSACMYRESVDSGSAHDYRYYYTIDEKGRIDHLDNYGRNILHYAILEEQLEMVKYLLANFEDLNCNQRDRCVKSPLHLAVSTGNEAMVKYLLSLGATVDSKDNEGRTPLHTAVEKGSVKIIKILLEAKSDINALDYSGQSTLILACLYNKCEVVEFLLKNRVKVNYEDDSGFTALKRAIYSKNAEVTRILIENGARICESQRLLHYAAVYDQREIVKSLLDGGARIEGRDARGKTPLMLAIQYRNYEVTELLLERGANPNAMSSIDGTCSLHTAIFYIDEAGILEPFLDILLKYGANVYQYCMFGYNALYYAFSHKNDVGACHLIKIMDVNLKFNESSSTPGDYMVCALHKAKGTLPIRYLLLAGYNMKNCPYSISDKKVEDMKPKEKYLYQFFCTPQSLQNLCRIQIRRTVKLQKIPELPLPPPIIDFLFMKMEALFYEDTEEVSGSNQRNSELEPYEQVVENYRSSLYQPFF